MAQAKPKAETAEKKATSRRNMPWSIKGVSPEAREAARKAVESGDMTMGEWLSEAIRSVAAEERGVSSAPEPAAAPTEITEDRLEPLAERIATAERRTALMVAPLHELLETIARRLEGLESRLSAASAQATATDTGNTGDAGNIEPSPPEGRP